MSEGNRISVLRVKWKGDVVGVLMVSREGYTVGVGVGRHCTLGVFVCDMSRVVP